jgi:Tfp pilus assembly protein PilO
MIRRYVAAGVIAVVLVALFGLFLIKPRLTEITDIREQIATQQAQNRSLQIRLRQLEQAAQNAPATVARLSLFDRLLPPTPDLPSLIRQLQGAATASGIDLVSIAPGTPQTHPEATGVEVVSVNLQIRGGFFRLESFLARLEDLQRVMEVTSIAIGPEVDEATGLQSLTSTITTRMYVVQPNARLGGAASSPAPSPVATPTR